MNKSSGISVNKIAINYIIIRILKFNTTVMGHGSGAAAAVYLTSSDKMSREAVSGVVAMSGTPYSQNSIDNSPRQSFEEVSTANKCSSSNNTEIIKCLRDVRKQMKRRKIRILGFVNQIQFIRFAIYYEQSFRH